MNFFRKFWRGFCLFVLLIAGCSLYPSITPASSQTSNLTPPPKASPQVTPPSTNVPALTQSSDIRLSTLKSGQYLVYSKPDGSDQRGSDQFSLFVVSLEGAVQGRITKGLPYGDVFPTPDRTSIYFEISKWIVRDLESGADRPVDILDGCNKVSVAPDGKNILASCLRDNKTGLYDIYLIQLDSTNARVPLTDCDAEGKLYGLTSFNCGAATWSPNGKWMVSHRSKATSGPAHPATGKYLTDMSCIPDIKECSAKTVGPFQIDRVAWSPDGNYLSGISPNPDNYYILILDVKSQTIQPLIDTAMLIDALSWSPDGKWIAFSKRGYGIFLVSMEKPRIVSLITDNVGSVLFWINMP